MAFPQFARVLPAAAAAWLLATTFVPAWAQEAHATGEEVELAAEVLALLNTARQNEGLTPLASSANLDLLAYQHSHEMAERGLVSHHSHRYGVNTKTRVRMAFPDVYQFGENVALNQTPQQLHLALQASTGHRLNRMDPGFTHVGLGVARVGDFQLFLTEIFVRVTDDAALARIDVLYSTLSADELPDDDPVQGEIVDEVLRIGAPQDDDPQYWTQRGLEAFDRGHYGEAVTLFEQAVDIDPTYAPARYDLARARLRNGEEEKALELLAEYLLDHPDDVDAWRTRGTAALLVQRYELALEAFRYVLERRARDAGSWYNFGLAQEMSGHPVDAARAYQQALHLDPELSQAAAALARVQQ